MLRKSPAFLAIVACGAFAVAQETQTQQQQNQRQQTQQNQQQQERTPANRLDDARPGQAQERQQREAGFRGTSDQQLESLIADCLILGNQEELALLKFAQQHTQNEQVKQFVQKAIQDHEKAVASLQKFGSRENANVELRASADDAATSDRAVATREVRRIGPDGKALDDDDAARDATLDRPQAPATAARNADAARQAQIAAADRTQTGAEGDIGRQMYQIQREAAQHCLAMIQKELGEEQGEKFDKAFLGQQVGMHIGMLAKLKAVEGHVSGELAQVVQQAQQTTKQHKEQAKQLMEQVAHGGDDAGRQPARPGAARETRTPVQPGESNRADSNRETPNRETPNRDAN
ncbi:MAG: DUF4142 domain-containing protein [Planctomyces sp.]|nr:DUF4142 domain-containing protein [Planctomyces sp.]